jgi:hypothetical protein
MEGLFKTKNVICGPLGLQEMKVGKVSWLCQCQYRSGKTTFNRYNQYVKIIGQVLGSLA